ncbi:hypothetical protein Fcan01_13915, partial [Folsomia candida]
FRVFYDQAVEGWYSSDYPLNRHVLRVDDRDLLYQAEKPLPSDKLIIIKDYCQSEVFFKDYIPVRDTEIKEMFQLQMTPEELARPPFRHWIDLISAAGENSVAIHIRRGDYAKLENNYGENYWLTPISFYQRGMKMMFEKLNVSKDVSFFVFSDQINDVHHELGRLLFDDDVQAYDKCKQHVQLVGSLSEQECEKSHYRSSLPPTNANHPSRRGEQEVQRV